MLLRVHQLLRSARPATIVILGLVTIVIVAWADYRTGPSIEAAVFYLPAIGAAAWYVGSRAGIGFAVLATVASLLSDLVSVAVPPTVKVLLINGGARLVFFLFAAEMISLVARQTARFSNLAREDPLTGIPNRRAFFEELERALARVQSYDEVNVEEFITGEEFTYDTICIAGRVVYENVCYYRPNPLIARSTEWISPQTIALRDLSPKDVQAGIALGHDVLKALDFGTGFTHMEWFYTPKGEAVFGEIAARPPGAHTVDLMNFVGDIDLFDGYAEADLTGTFSGSLARKYNAANIFKRAQGTGRIRRIEGLESIMARFGEHIVHVDLLPVGAERRNWIQTLVSDGYVVVRHPDLQACYEIADAICSCTRAEGLS